ncbi:MAG TPA: Kdo hydroxylase family protein [Blastocatellia bacterium]|nr:Kdo hydroxylase family protein [Blastocatellia bacterium]
MQLVEVKNATKALDDSYYRKLESGDVLFFPRCPFDLKSEDTDFLLSQRQQDASYHKNIAYKPNIDKITGVASDSERERLRAIMKNYCETVTQLLKTIMPRYAAHWQLDYTSFRPQEEEGRNLSLHSRNDLLHVDAFPGRPTNGNRILRFFTNINPTKSRVWQTSDSFDVLAYEFAMEAGLMKIARWSKSSLRKNVLSLSRTVGITAGKRSPYDQFMLKFHDFLKENQRFQEACPKVRTEFPPGSCWLVFTDMVSHSVLSGQFALEQTFIVARESLVNVAKAPINILEDICGTTLSDPL